MSLPRDTRMAFAVGSVTMRATIDPCSWMYPMNCQCCVEYELPPKAGDTKPMVAQARIHLERPMEQCSLADLEARCAAILLQPCSRCGDPAFDGATVDTNRGSLCERCFLSDLDARLAADMKKIATATRRRDLRYKKKGFTHKVRAWVHPSAGGDDYQLEIYAKGKPDAKTIKDALKREGSCILDDYVVEELT